MNTPWTRLRKIPWNFFTIFASSSPDWCFPPPSTASNPTRNASPFWKVVPTFALFGARTSTFTFAFRESFQTRMPLHSVYSHSEFAAEVLHWPSISPCSTSRTQPNQEIPAAVTRKASTSWTITSVLAWAWQSLCMVTHAIVLWTKWHQSIGTCSPSRMATQAELPVYLPILPSEEKLVEKA